VSCCPAPDGEAAGLIGEAIIARVAGFSRLLRQHGFAVGLKETSDALRIAAALQGESLGRVKAAFRSLFCSRVSEWKAFDPLFESHWRGFGMKKVVKTGGSAATAAQRSLGTEAGAKDGGRPQALAEQLEGSGEGVQDGPEGKAEGASPVEISGSVDFRKIADPAALAKAHEAAERLARVMQARRTRRYRAQAKGQRIDLRSTIRHSTARGGVPIDLMRRRPREKPFRFILLLDASGSMQMYTAVFMRFIHGVLDSFHEAEAFVFHTRLAHVSAAMREKDAMRALERLSLISQGVGGGTRIGECLADFNRFHAKRVLTSRSCVAIVSDGYDTGDPEMLGRELRRLRRHCRRIIWLNPMLGWEGYKPEARAMKAALPYLDVFAPANTLDSLAALEPVLARL
jgi:uncharacterized protein with von Willebrand factor type A (vWA) domain